VTTVLLARHGETDWNREGRVQGWAPTGLTDHGRQQARKLGTWLDDHREIDRVVASDLRRTRETTAAVRASATGLPEPTFDRAWRERGFGVEQGFLATELLERYPDHDPDESVSALAIDPEGGERLDGFCERVESTLEELGERCQPGETALVVTHGGVIKTLVAAATERSREAALADSSPPNGSVTEVRLSEGLELRIDGLTPWQTDS